MFKTDMFDGTAQEIKDMVNAMQPVSYIIAVRDVYWGLRGGLFRDYPLPPVWDLKQTTDFVKMAKSLGNLSTCVSTARGLVMVSVTYLPEDNTYSVSIA